MVSKEVNILRIFKNSLLGPIWLDIKQTTSEMKSLSNVIDICLLWMDVGVVALSLLEMHFSSPRMVLLS